MVRIFYPEDKEAIENVRSLMVEYATSMGLNLGYQNFENELQTLPGKYAPPTGCLLLAKEGEKPVGCIAIRKIDGLCCEMKRLFVLPAYRGKGVGRLLVETIIQKAKELGYSTIKLDTVESMREAVSLYRSLGFINTGAYIYNPSEDVVYLELLI